MSRIPPESPRVVAENGTREGSDWNYLQVETAGRMLHPVLGPGGMTREQAHREVRALLNLHVESTPHASGLLDAWDEGAADDTVFAGPFLWAIYEADDTVVGGREWVDDLARGLRRGGSKTRVVW
ncbi:hypothetical protein ACFXQA_13365 [Microbacterium sp. P07]|uniref:hypothetical protein n=1 Tax=Microbacterium sp. P07 TaxID=3366952 RepID=UPI0037456921